MTALVYFFVSPGGVTTLFVAGAVAVVVRPQSPGIRRVVLAVALVYGIASIYAVPAAAARVFEAGYRKFDVHDVTGRVAIVVLGAGDEAIFGWNDERLFLPYPSAAAR